MLDQPTIVFVTVCTRRRAAWLASDAVHTRLVHVWQHATTWRIGRYVLLPDHLHLFCAPTIPERSLAAWVAYWKSQFTKLHRNPLQRWQPGLWDTRLRSDESYEAKWEYVRTNPVRHSLVQNADDWPYQGELHRLDWW